MTKEHFLSMCRQAEEARGGDAEQTFRAFTLIYREALLLEYFYILKPPNKILHINASLKNVI